MEYNLKVTDEDLAVMSRGLVDLPYRTVAGLIEKLSAQVQEQKHDTVKDNGGANETP